MTVVSGTQWAHGRGRGRRTARDGLRPPDPGRDARPGGGGGRARPVAARAVRRRARDPSGPRVRELDRPEGRGAARGRGDHRDPGRRARRARGAAGRAGLPHPAGEAHGHHRGGRGTGGDGGRARRDDARGLSRAPLYALYPENPVTVERRAHRHPDQRPASGAGRVVASRALVRPRQLAAGGRLRPDADDQVGARHRLDHPCAGRASVPGGLVRAALALPAGEPSGGGRRPLPGLRDRGRLSVLGQTALPVPPRRTRAGGLAGQRDHPRLHRAGRHRGAARRPVRALRVRL